MAISRAKTTLFSLIILAFISGAIFILVGRGANPLLKGDANNDNKVDVTDLSILLSQFLTTNPASDFNGDGAVNIVDLSILLTNFGRSLPSGSPVQGPVKGIVTNWSGWGLNDQVASEIKAFGATWVREDFDWSDIESTKGVYNWAASDQLVTKAKANNFTVLPVLGYAPSWTQSSDSLSYSKFIAEAVRRYGPGTSANLQVFELWNEPYLPNSWGVTPDARAYAHNVVAAVREARKINPNAKFLISGEFTDWPQNGTSPWLTTWVDDLFVAEPTIGQYFDAVAHHTYGGDPLAAVKPSQPWLDTTGGLAVARIDTVRQKFLNHGVDVPFWITEMGYSTGIVSESTAATYYTNYSTFIASRPWIRAIFPFCLREFRGDGTSEPEFGLLNYGDWAQKADYLPAKQLLNNLK